MQNIAEVNPDLKCITRNMEKYISFSLGKLIFIDSYQFMHSSLDNLVQSNGPESFAITSLYEEDFAKRKLLLQKGLYPYEYMDS